MSYNKNNFEKKLSLLIKHALNKFSINLKINKEKS